MPSAHSVKLRPLEREDLRYVHQLDNNASVMRYWFEEPYEAFVELSDLYVNCFCTHINKSLNVTGNKLCREANGIARNCLLTSLIKLSC